MQWIETDVCVIGAGSGGLSVAAGAVQMGARVVLIDGVGTVAVYSHRIYGKEAAGSMGEWVKANGPAIEKALMAWDRIPSPAALRSLPQTK